MTRILLIIAILTSTILQTFAGELIARADAPDLTVEISIETQFIAASDNDQDISNCCDDDVRENTHASSCKVDCKLFTPAYQMPARSQADPVILLRDSITLTRYSILLLRPPIA